MFSIGNINEKLRIAKMDCRGETVVDMFTGIGYFTLPYLVHANASHVYAVDWNPDALEALRRNLEVNKVADRCTVLEGDCRKVAPPQVADRVNLGLLPTAKHYWLTGAKTLKPIGGIMHIRDTITSSKMIQRKTSLPANSLNIKPKKNDEKVGKNSVTITKQMSLQEPNAGPSNCKISDAPMVPNGAQNESEEQPSTRKLSRSASIVQEIESKPIREPQIKEDFRNESWDCLDREWKKFCLDAAWKITGFLNNLHEDLNWQSNVLRIGKIKSYAPHVDHVVLDLECRPE